MEQIPLAIIGCGGMGGRHLLGLKELDDSGLNNVELVAVCDLRRDNAEYLADQAEERLGTRPRVFEDVERFRRFEHVLVVVVVGQRVGFEEDRVGDGDLADVVQDGAPAQLPHPGVRHAATGRQVGGVLLLGT